MPALITAIRCSSAGSMLCSAARRTQRLERCCQTGVGSSHYHWDPNDGTLFWDRLLMTLSFAAIFALVVRERVDARGGALLLWPSLAIGLFSLLLWRWTGDLRLYFWVQFFPGLAVLLLFLLYPPKHTATSY